MQLHDGVLAHQDVRGRAAGDGRGLVGERHRVEHVDVELLRRGEVVDDDGDVRHALQAERVVLTPVRVAERRPLRPEARVEPSQMPPVAGWNSSMPGVSFGWQNTVVDPSRRR